MKKLLVILGPTATGKTDLALNLARKFSGELVSADSRQVYAGLDIGTGKMPGSQSQVARVKKEVGFWEFNGIKVWIYDVVTPQIQYSVADYVKDAWQVIDDIEKRGRLPIVVGGTGLYIKALLEDLSNLNVPVNLKLRRELEKLSLKELQEKLQKLNFQKWQSLNNSEKNNPRRVLRSIEIIAMNPYINKSAKRKVLREKLDILKIGLTAPRQILNSRIDARVLSRLDQGMIEEAEKLHQQGLSFLRMRQLGLEYGCLADLLENKINQEQFVTQLQTKIHQFAKRQMTWFKKDQNIHWFNISEENWPQKVEKMILKWYYYPNDKTD